MRIRALLTAVLVAAIVPAVADASWSPPVRISEPGTERGPGMGTLLPSGDVAFAWTEGPGTLRAVVGPAADPGLATTLDTGAASHDLAVAGDGTVLVAWAADGVVKAAVRAPGESFGTATTLDPGPATTPSAAANARGDLAVAWAGEDGSVRVSVRSAGGGWSAEAEPASDQADGTDVALTPDGAAIVAWPQNNGELRVATRAADGSVGAPQTLQSEGLGNARVAADGQGGAVVVFHRLGGPPQAAFREPGGGFGPAHEFGDGVAGLGTQPEPLLAPDGHLLVVSDGALDGDTGTLVAVGSTAARAIGRARMLDTAGNFVHGAMTPDGTALVAWEHNAQLLVQRLDRAGAAVSHEVVTCTPPSTGRIEPLGIGPDGRGVLAVGHEPLYVHKPGWNLVREGGDEFGPAVPGCYGGPYPIVTPQVAGPNRIDLRGMTERPYAANWWKVDADLDGTFEHISHTGVIDVVWDEGNHGVVVEHCAGPRFEEWTSCSSWGEPFPIYIGRAFTLPPPAPPAQKPAIEADVAPRGRLRRVLGRGLPVRLKALRAARVRIGLHVAERRVGRWTTSLRAGARRRVAVRVRRSFARRARRARRVRMMVRVTAGDLTIRRRVLLRR